MPKKIDWNEVDELYRRMIVEFSACESGSRLPSFPELRSRFGCSRKVLECVLERLEAEKRIRIFPRRGIFWEKCRSSSCRIAVFRTDWPQEYAMCLEKRLEEYFSKLPGVSFEVVLLPVESVVNDYLKNLSPEFCDIAIVTCNFTHFDQKDVGRLLSELRVPVIFLENHIVCRPVNLIDSKPEYSGMLAADYLYRRGHRRIAVVNAERLDRDICLERELDGFTSYLALHGIKPEIIDCRHPSQASSFGAVEDKGKKYLEEHGIHFSAVFASSVETARGFCNVLRDHGLSVPDDVSIIANSEVPSAAHTVPPLTTVARDFDGYAKTAVKMVEMIRQGIQPGIIRVPSYIVERESVKDLCQK